MPSVSAGAVACRRVDLLADLVVEPAFVLAAMIESLSFGVLNGRNRKAIDTALGTTEERGMKTGDVREKACHQ
jgi:hypothetical protein